MTPRRIGTAAGAVILIVLVLVFGGALADLYADHLWFASLGYEGRFWKLTLARIGAWILVVGAASAVLYWILVSLVGQGDTIRLRHQLGGLRIAEALPRRWIRLAALGVAFLVAMLVAGPRAGTLGESVLFALYSRPWGAPDPILGHDPRLYLFILPVLRSTWSVLLTLTVWAGLAAAAVLLGTGRITYTDQGRLRLEPGARRWLAGFGAVLLVLVAAHFGLSALEEVSEGPVRYATARGEIPARRLAAVIALFAAGVLLYAERQRRMRIAVTGVAVLIAVWILGIGVYPNLVQRFRVEPNELELERPYIAAQIEATRAAFGIAALTEEPYPIRNDPPPRAEVEWWTETLPLWDERPLRATFDQLQGLVAYHRFADVDDDRYGPQGAREQVAIGVRELAPGLLGESARTWVNLHMRYTHGRGAVISPVNRVSPGGEPHYFLKNLPPEPSPDAPAGVRLPEPRIFFGELTTQFALVSPDSLPGDGVGIRLEGLIRRALLAWALGSKNLLLRGGDGEPPVLLWRRQVVARTRALAPFFLVDPDPLPVIAAGRVRWIVPLYAVAWRYPLADGTELRGLPVNYVREAARAVVDGATGEVRIYLLAPDDPLVATYAGLFPDLFLPLEAMPDGIRRHLRYPRPLLQAQAEVLRAYHLTEPSAFYNRQDLWSIAREEGGAGGAGTVSSPTMTPYYVLMPPAGRAEAPTDRAEAPAGEIAAPPREREFLLMLPFTPRARDNLVSFLIAHSDPGRYGELRLHRISSARQVFGPRQIEVQIEQDPYVSQQLSLWRQLGSRVTRGHVVLVPMDGFLLYVQPLLLEAEEDAAPGLERVIVAAGDRVSMRPTLDGALTALLTGAPSPRLAGLNGAGAAAADAGDAGTRADDSGADSATGGAAAAPAPGAEGRLRALRGLLDEADAALRAGDLVRFGEIWERIRAAAESAADGEDNAADDGGAAGGGGATDAADAGGDAPGGQDGQGGTRP